MIPASPVDIVLVNWNSGSQLRLAVESVLSDGNRNGAVSIVVVDNGSWDASLNGLDSLRGVQVLRNGKNLGFAAACNQGAALGGGQFILFLNPDAAVFQDTIRRSVEFMLRPDSVDVGICGVQLVDAAGIVQRSCARFPDAKMYLAQAFGFAGVSPSRFSHIMMTFDHQETRDVDHVMGAYLLIRRSLFESLGGFDERFFVYLEDLDLALRAKRLGWRSVFLAQARAYHKGGGVSDQVRARRLFYALRSRILYAFKHFNRAQAWAVCFATLAIEPAPRLMRGLLRFSGRELVDTVHGFALLWWDLPSMLRRALCR